MGSVRPVDSAHAVPTAQNAKSARNGQPIVAIRDSGLRFCDRKGEESQTLYCELLTKTKKETARRRSRGAVSLLKVNTVGGDYLPSAHASDAWRFPSRNVQVILR